MLWEWRVLELFYDGVLLPCVGVAGLECKVVSWLFLAGYFTLLAFFIYLVTCTSFLCTVLCGRGVPECWGTGKMCRGIVDYQVKVVYELFNITILTRNTSRDLHWSWYYLAVR